MKEALKANMLNSVMEISHLVLDVWIAAYDANIRPLKTGDNPLPRLML